MILDALVNQPTEEKFIEYWNKVEQLLVKDYLIHEFTVHYWKGMTTEFEWISIMTPLIQGLISKMNKIDKYYS